MENKPTANVKSVRKRLQRQLEFYLSASNLRQDKFLQQHMDEHGFLDVALFLSFNKLRAMHATEKLLLEAATKSEAIRVDTTGRTRIAPVDFDLPRTEGDAEVDDRTIYVEGFDVGVHDHDSLRKAFAAFGKVTFVSMPRFTHNRMFKGFAFVEFATTASAQEALQATRSQDSTEAHAALQGMRAMSKGEWVTMKDQLKAQLQQMGSCTNGPPPSEKLAVPAKSKPTKPQSASTTTAATTTTTVTKRPAPDAIVVTGHVRFQDDEEDPDNNQDNKRQRTA